jgi:hypothetical protein
MEPRCQKGNALAELKRFKVSARRAESWRRANTLDAVAKVLSLP